MDLKAAILEGDDKKLEKVPVPEWPDADGHLYVRVMEGWERDDFDSRCAEGRTIKSRLQNIRARVAVRTLCDKDGAKVFTEAEIGVLTKRSSVALDRIFDVACALNGITSKSVDELVKNSEAAPSGDSG